MISAYSELEIRGIVKNLKKQVRKEFPKCRIVFLPYSIGVGKHTQVRISYKLFNRTTGEYITGDSINSII